MDILKREYIGLLIVSFISLILFVGFFKAILYGAIITVAKYLVDKYLSDKLNSLIDFIIKWFENRF